MTVNPGNGSASQTTKDEIPEGEDSIEISKWWTGTNPTRAGYTFLGWYVGTTKYDLNEPIELTTKNTSVTVTGQWARVNVTMTPEFAVVAPSTPDTIKLTATQVPETAGIPTQGVSYGTPKIVSVTPSTVTAELNAATSTISFTAPSTQPQQVTIAVSYMNGTAQTGSGYATTTIYVADASAVKVAASPAAGGTATKSAVNAQGQVTISATPNPSYNFTGWTFTPAEGVTWNPTTAGVNMAAAALNVPTYAGTWTATFAQTVKVYRLYNPFDKLHLYTTDEGEWSRLIGAGWNDEGVAWNAPKYGTGAFHIERLYNPYSHDHYYVPSTEQSEIQFLTDSGWLLDSSQSWFDSAAVGGPYPIYQLFNPYRDVDTHLWTSDVAEYNDLALAGWQKNGTPIYAASYAE